MEYRVEPSVTKDSLKPHSITRIMNNTWIRDPLLAQTNVSCIKDNSCDDNVRLTHNSKVIRVLLCGVNYVCVCVDDNPTMNLFVFNFTYLWKRRTLVALLRELVVCFRTFPFALPINGLTLRAVPTIIVRTSGRRRRGG